MLTAQELIDLLQQCATPETTPVILRRPDGREVPLVAARRELEPVWGGGHHDEVFIVEPDEEMFWAAEREANRP